MDPAYKTDWLTDWQNAGEIHKMRGGQSSRVQEINIYHIPPSLMREFL